MEQTTSLNYDSADLDCKARTSNQGGLAEVRDNYTRDYIWANASMDLTGRKSIATVVVSLTCPFLFTFRIPLNFYSLLDRGLAEEIRIKLIIKINSKV